jgi:hypothetical protein
MTQLTVFTIAALPGVGAALAWLVRVVRADGYGWRRPPAGPGDVAVNGLPNGPYALTPQR